MWMQPGQSAAGGLQSHADFSSFGGCDGAGWREGGIGDGGSWKESGGDAGNWGNSGGGGSSGSSKRPAWAWAAAAEDERRPQKKGKAESWGHKWKNWKKSEAASGHGEADALAPQLAHHMTEPKTIRLVRQDDPPLMGSGSMGAASLGSLDLGLGNLPDVAGLTGPLGGQLGSIGPLGWPSGGALGGLPALAGGLSRLGDPSGLGQALLNAPQPPPVLGPQPKFPEQEKQHERKKPSRPQRWYIDRKVLEHGGDPTKVPGYKSQMCKFFQNSGGCERGDLCTYAHSEEEIHKYGKDENGEPRTGANPGSKDALKDGRLFGNVYKRSLCKHFQERGRCLKGNECTYAHGESELIKHAQNNPTEQAAAERARVLNLQHQQEKQVKMVLEHLHEKMQILQSKPMTEDLQQEQQQLQLQQQEAYLVLAHLHQQTQVLQAGYDVSALANEESPVAVPKLDPQDPVVQLTALSEAGRLQVLQQERLMRAQAEEDLRISAQVRSELQAMLDGTANLDRRNLSEAELQQIEYLEKVKADMEDREALIRKGAITKALTDFEPLCGDYKNGKCTRGENCRYSHGIPQGESRKGCGKGDKDKDRDRDKEKDKDQDQDPEKEDGEGEGDSSASSKPKYRERPSVIPPGMTPLFDPETQSVVLVPHKQDSRYKSQLCKFHPMGKCQRGTDCTYAHGVEDLVGRPEHLRKLQAELAFGVPFEQLGDGTPAIKLNTGPSTYAGDVTSAWLDMNKPSGDYKGYGVRSSGSPSSDVAATAIGGGPDRGTAAVAPSAAPVGIGGVANIGSPAALLGISGVTNVGPPTAPLPILNTPNAAALPQAPVTSAASAPLPPPTVDNKSAAPLAQQIGVTAVGHVGAGAAASGQGAGLKKELCKFWSMGACAKGDQCENRHDDGEIVGNTSAELTPPVLMDSLAEAEQTRKLAYQQLLAAVGLDPSSVEDQR